MSDDKDIVALKDHEQIPAQKAEPPREELGAPEQKNRDIIRAKVRRIELEIRSLTQQVQDLKREAGL